MVAGGSRGRPGRRIGSRAGPRVGAVPAPWYWLPSRFTVRKMRLSVESGQITIPANRTRHFRMRFQRLRQNFAPRAPRGPLRLVSVRVLSQGPHGPASERGFWIQSNPGRRPVKGSGWFSSRVVFAPLLSANTHRCRQRSGATCPAIQLLRAPQTRRVHPKSGRSSRLPVRSIDGLR